MKKLLGCLIVILGLGAFQLPAVTSQSIGDQAYSDLISRFWYGAATNGYVIDFHGTVYGSPAGNPAGAPLVPVSGHLWQYAQLVNAIYGYWLQTSSSDAANRIQSEWTWIKRFYAAGTDVACGSGTVNVASDDVAWVAGLFIEIYEVTADSVALSRAKSVLDCAWTRWSDNGTAGCFSASTAGSAIWYDDTCAAKSSYQGPYALDNYWYYQKSGDTTYRTRAIGIDSWLSANLQRSGQTVNGQVFPNDGMYWVAMNANGTISGFSNPYGIAPAGSVILLAGDMGEAVLGARLYVDTGTPSYLTRLNATAVSDKTYMTVNGGMISCRDARVDGWASVMFAREVVPILTSIGTFSRDGFRATARIVRTQDRSDDQTYAASWNGPINNTDIWATQNGLYSQQVEASANAAIWSIAGMGF